MTKINATQAAHNFGTLKALLLATSPSQKATDFANRVFAQIDSKGGEWMAKNAAELQIICEYGSAEDDRRSPAPVTDNRAWFMGKLQTALTNG